MSGFLRQALRALGWLARFASYLLIGFVAIEAVASLALAANHSLQASNASLRNADAYAGATWVDDYFREFGAADQLQWRSYVYWRRRPFHGTFINIDSAGRRVTWQPPAGAGPSGKAVTIYMFGGSTLWGTGVRDDFTVASHLAKMLWDRGIPAHVVNFGETGYVTTQEVIALSQELPGSGAPDLVILYDGINDIFSSLQNGVPGKPQNEINREREFNVLNPEHRGDLARELFGWEGLRGTATFQVVSAVLKRVAPAGSATVAMPPTLVDETVARYKANVRQVEALGAAYGFESLFYWQPLVFDKITRTPYEQSQARDNAYLEGPVGAVEEALARDGDLKRDQRFRSLSSVFATRAEPVFIDMAHLSEAGNAVVAGMMLGDVLGALSRRR